MSWAVGQLQGWFRHFPAWMSHLSKNSTMITLLCCSAWMWTGISGMHGQWKQCDCLGCKIMENSFSLFLYIDFYCCHCHTTALGGGVLKICNLRRARMEFHLTFRKSVYNFLPIWMQNKCPKRAGEMAQLGKCLMFNDKGLGFISGYGHCVAPT